jgi:acyl carrier protein
LKDGLEKNDGDMLDLWKEEIRVRILKSNGGMMEETFDVHKQPAGGRKKGDIREGVIGIVSRVTKISASQITAEQLIRDDLGVDSMQAIEALAILEKEFNIIIDPEKAFNVVTVNDLFGLIEESIAHSPQGVA